MRRSNTFDGLRLLAALVVVADHAPPLLGAAHNGAELIGLPVRAPGVAVFFAISGFLTTASWLRLGNLAAYVGARAIRILPALLVALALLTLVLGPLVTTLPLADYLTTHRTATYLISNLRLEPQYDLPGVFGDVSYPHVVNGSLWTMPAEIACYLLVPVLFLARGRARVVSLGAFLAAAAWVAHAGPAHLVVYGTDVRDAAGAGCFFAVGALLRVAVEERPGILRWDVGVGLAGGLLAVSLAVPDVAAPLWYVVLPYVVVAVGQASVVGLRSAARFGDLSYGIFLYAFPVQQLVVWRFGRLPIALDLVVVVLVSAALALASWHLVEKHALRLKKPLVAWAARRHALPARVAAGGPA